MSEPGPVPLRPSNRQSDLLVAIHHRVYGYGMEGVSPTELAFSLGLSASTVSRLIHRARDQGLVEPVIDPVDRRRRLYRLTDAGRRRAFDLVPVSEPEREVARVRLWRPTRTGPLTDDDLAEAAILLDTLGAWVAQLSDGDSRIREAEAVHLILRTQVALESDADRVFVRRAVEKAAVLVGGEIRTAVAAAVRDVGPEVGAPLREAIDLVVAAAERDDDEAWYPGIDQVDTALDRLLTSVPPSNTPAPEGRVGRGKLIKKLALGAGSAWATGALRTAAPDLTDPVWNLVTSILTLIGL